MKSVVLAVWYLGVGGDESYFQKINRFCRNIDLVARGRVVEEILHNSCHDNDIINWDGGNIDYECVEIEGETLSFENVI